jgi:F-type H+-transporting ATPase subunit a
MIGVITLEIQSTVFSIMIVSLILMVFIFVVNKKIKEADPLEKPKGIVLLATLIVSSLSKFTKDNIDDKSASNYAPYIGVLALYLFVSNISGLIGISPPTKNYSVTLTFTIITFVLIQRATFKTVGIKGFLKSFIEPHPAFFIMNFFGKIAPLISMSVRLFGNITSGAILLMLLYNFTAYLSSMVPVIGAINFIGPFIAPFLHFYFDLFVGAIQMFIFISLTTVFIGNELSQ